MTRQSHMSDDAAGVAAMYNVALAGTIAFIILVTCLFWMLPGLFGERVTEILTLRLGATEDIPLVGLFLLLALLRPRRVADQSLGRIETTAPLMVLSAVAIFLIGWVGNRIVFHSYLLSRDEQLAVFDQQIFAHGRLFWPIPTQWRDFAAALNLEFMRPIGSNEYWVSGYLPIHAGFRALMQVLGIADLASPIMGAFSAIALWLVARKLWPDSNGTVALALLLLATSSQVLITSMTAFAMNMHLALNLLWLALFLADRRQTHVLAVVVGFFATGIHQPFFHPLFALPFLVSLIERRSWHLLAFYLVSYAAIGLFWLEWPKWITSHGTSGLAAIKCASAACNASAGPVERLQANFNSFGLQKIWITTANLLRFVCWQHPILLPLSLFGAIACWRQDPLVRALAYGFALPIIVIGIVLAWQGYGWGYRYVHPVLGNVILLACYGFRRVERAGLSLKGPLVITTVTAVLLVPLHAWMVERFATPFRQIHNSVQSIPADVVIVDTTAVPFGQDLVINRFDVTNRPVLMMAQQLTTDDVLALCKKWTINFYDVRRMAPISRLFALPAPIRPSSNASMLEGLAKQDRCRLAQ